MKKYFQEKMKNLKDIDIENIKKSDNNITILFSKTLKELANTGYRYLTDTTNEDFSKVENYTLQDFIYLEWNKFTHQYYSVDENAKLKGYIGYTVDIVSRAVVELKIMSFDLAHLNVTLFRDLKNLLEMFFNEKNYKRVSWDALTENPANKIYKKVINEYKNKENYKCSIYQDGKFTQYIIRKEVN